MAGADDPRFERTRRSMIRMAAASLGLGAVGAAGGHPEGSKGGGVHHDGHDHGDPDHHDDRFAAARLVGYHSLGRAGRASRYGRPELRKDGDRNAELRTHRDLAAVAFRFSDEEDPGRRMALLDIGEFNDAEVVREADAGPDQTSLEEAELHVHSILRNQNAETNMATDLELSDDGEYAFLGTQALYPTEEGGHGSNGAIDTGDPRATPSVTGGVAAVDISNRDRPRTVDNVTLPFSTGIHNLYHHRIDGDDYVFACKDVGLLSPDSGVYVLRFDREPGKLTIVNRWTSDGNTVRGGIGADHGLSYVHDIEVQDDPRTGRPTAYVADWDRGMRVLDVSDPTDIQHVGQFDMHQSHFATPAPALIEMPGGGTKRIAVASHEEPDERFDQRDDLNAAIYNTPHPEKTNPNSTGTVFLVDCDGIYPDDPNYDDVERTGDGAARLGELDNWTWKNVDTDDDVDHGDIYQSSFSFTLSPHNSKIVRHEIDGEERFFIYQGSYHLGVRYLEIVPGDGDGLAGDDRRKRRAVGFDPSAVDDDIDPANYPHAGEEFGWINHGTDWTITETGHAQPMKPAAGGKTPDFWCSVEQNGVTFNGDRTGGVYATHFDEAPLSDPLPLTDVSRGDDGVAFTAGQTNRLTIEVTAYDRDPGADVHVRDRIPDGYEVVGGDELADVYPQGNRRAVEFAETVAPGEHREFTLFVEVPEDPGGGTFGPVEISGDGEEWVGAGETTDTNVSTGVSQ